VNSEFAEFCGSLGLSLQFAAPAKGNEKGGVEGLHGYIEDNVFVPMPVGASLHVINEYLAAFCREDMKRAVAAGETVASRFEREALVLRPLPALLPSACIREYARTNNFSEATHKTNRYSVPTAYAHQDAVVECYADRVRVVLGREVIAEHPRCFGKHQSILDPLQFSRSPVARRRSSNSSIVTSSKSAVILSLLDQQALAKRTCYPPSA
jgi:hypothetical protein